MEPVSASVLTLKLLGGGASKFGSVVVGALLARAQKKPGGPESDLPVAIELASEVLPDHLRATGQQALKDWSRTQSFKDTIQDVIAGRRVVPDMLDAFAHPRDFPHPLTLQDGSRALAETFLLVLLSRVVVRDGHQLQLEDHQLMLSRLDEHDALRRSEHLELLESVQDLKDTWNRSVTALPIREPTTPQSAFEERFVRIQYSLADEAYAAAERRLTALEPAQAEMTSLEYARYLRLRGALAQRLGQMDQAIQFYETAFEHDRTSAAASRMQGVADYLRGTYAAALTHLDAALAHDPRDVGALTTKMYVLMAQHDADGMQALDDARPSLDPEFALARARSRIARKLYPGAIHLLNGLIAQGHAEGRVRLALAAASVLPFQDRMLAEEWPLERVHLESQADPHLDEALTAVHLALTDPKHQLRLPSERMQAFNLQQVVLVWREGFQALHDSCVQALTEDPSNVESRRHLILALRKLNRHPEIWPIFEQFPEGHRDVESTISAAETAVWTGRAAHALPELERLLGVSLTEEQRSDVTVTYARALLSLQRSQDLRTFLDKQPPGEFAVELARAELEVHDGRLEPAMAAYRRVIEAAAPESVPAARVQYAFYLLHLAQSERRPQHTTEAHEQMRLALTGSLSAGALDALLPELVNSGHYEDAAVALQRLSTLGPLTSSARQAQALVAVHQDRAEEAAHLLRSLTTDEPTNVSAAFNLVAVLRNTQQISAATEEVSRIVTAHPALTPRELQQAAELARSLGQAELALDWGYQARRMAYSNPEVHRWYGLMGMELMQEVDQPVVGPESAVLLKNEKRHQQWIILTSDQSPRRELGEYALEGRVAQSLLGKRVGDEVEVRHGVGGRVAIQLILSKNAHAVRQFAREHTLTFLDDDALVVGEFLMPPSASSGLPEAYSELLKEFQELAVERAKFRQQLDATGSPLSTNAVLAEQTGTEFWIQEFERHAPVLGFTSTREDQQAAITAVSSAVVLDPSVLISLARAQRLELLLVWEGELIVTRVTLDALERASGLYTTAQVAWQFVVTHCSIDSESTLPYEALGSILPPDTYSSVMAADRLTLPLVTDDSRYRSVMRQGNLGPAVVACGSIDLALQLKERQMMSPRELIEVMFQLFGYGRQFFPFTRDFLKFAFGKTDHDAEVLDEALTLLLASEQFLLGYRADVLTDVVDVLAERLGDGEARLNRLLDHLELSPLEDEQMLALLDAALTNMVSLHASENLARLTRQIASLRTRRARPAAEASYGGAG